MQLINNCEFNKKGITRLIQPTQKAARLISDIRDGLMTLWKNEPTELFIKKI